MFTLYKNEILYQKDKEKLQKEARERYLNLSVEEKGTRWIEARE